ncbi:MAG: NAD(P)-dependent oxidoreductase [Planctomycetota bacterium]
MAPANSRAQVGFIGLGIMGTPMAHNILKAGFELTVFNRTPAKCQSLQAAGASVAASPAQVAEAAEIVLSCVTASQDVLKVVLDRERGVIAGVRPGSVVIDCSTVSPQVAGKCSSALGEKGAGFLDAPVSGGDVGARAGTLSVMVGGEKSHFDLALPVLQAVGETITYCGPAGSGYLVKLCNQILVSMHCLAAAEALTLARAAGIDPQAMLAAVAGGAAGSWQLSNLGEKMTAGDYAPGFFVDYLLKDLRLALEAAEEAKVSLSGTSLAESMFRLAAARGHGRLGTQAIFDVVSRP